MGKKNDGEKPRRNDKPRNDKPGKDKPPKTPSWYQNTGNWGPGGIHYEDSQFSDSGVIYNPQQIAKLKQLGLLEDPAGARQAWKAWNNQAQMADDRIRNDPFVGNNPDTWQGAMIATGLPAMPQNTAQLGDLMSQGMTYTQAVQQLLSQQQPTQVPNPGLGGDPGQRVLYGGMNGTKPPMGSWVPNTMPPSMANGPQAPSVATPGPTWMGGKGAGQSLVAPPQAHGIAMGAYQPSPGGAAGMGQGAGDRGNNWGNGWPGGDNRGKIAAPSPWTPGMPSPIGPGGPRAPEATAPGGRRRFRGTQPPYNARY